MSSSLFQGPCQGLSWHWLCGNMILPFLKPLSRYFQTWHLPTRQHWHSTCTIHIFKSFNQIMALLKHSRIFTVVVLLCWFSVRNVLEDNDLSLANSHRNHSIVSAQSTGATPDEWKQTFYEEVPKREKNSLKLWKLSNKKCCLTQDNI